MKTEKTNSRICYEWLLDQDPFVAQDFFKNVDLDKVDKGGLEYTIGAAFDWEETTQGYAFWKELNKNWKEYVKTQGSEDIKRYKNMEVKEISNFEKCHEWLKNNVDEGTANYYYDNANVVNIDDAELKYAVAKAFDWDKTYAGFNFWGDISIRWKEYVKSQEGQEDDPHDSITPAHYNKGEKEVWEMMVTLFGKDEFKSFCRLNAFKYRMRAGEKTEDPTEDIAKAKWYENKLKELNK